MNVSKDNTIFVYREGDSDSYEIALEYQRIHNLDFSHLVAIPCSNTEILNSYADFQSEVEDPIKSAMSTLVDPYDFKYIFVIVLGFNVPGGFYDEGHIISSTSRISRINYSLSKKSRNVLYDRRVFKRFDENDASEALITSRIDGPDKDTVLNLLKKSEILVNQLFVNGKLYFDPYSSQTGIQADTYTIDLFDFQDNILPTLNIESNITTFIDPYIDPTHPFVQKDSFYWGWFRDTADLSFFRNTATSRIFFYNADFDGGYSVRSSSSDRWPQLSIMSGYVATAGAMSNPTIEGFLRPSPFFEALKLGATIGEAYLFSNQFFDWTIQLLGDPLVRIAFPATFDGEADNNEKDEAWMEMVVNTSRIIAYQIKRLNELIDIRGLVLISNDAAVEAAMLANAYNAASLSSSDIYQSTNDLVVGLASYLITSRLAELELTVDQYLERTNFKISTLIASSLGLSVSSSNVLTPGSWQIDSEFIDEIGSFAKYHFLLEVSSDEDFSEILMSIDSSADNTNWHYEVRDEQFLPLPEDGVGSNFVGLRIRYNSKDSEKLTRGETYFFRISEIANDVIYDPVNYEEVIYT